MIFYSFYWAKTAFVSLMMISSITFEAMCSGPVSALFNSLIVGITSANKGEHSAASISNQRPLELKLADAQMLQQWIGQIARKIVVEDGIFAGNYLCCPNININAVILTDGLPQERIKKIVDKKLKEVQNLEQKGQFLKLLFSFGAMLSAEIGEQLQQNGTIRALLKAYECVGKQFNGISDFVIGAVIKSPIVQLKVDKIILESHPISNLNPSYIHEFSLLNALNVEMTPKDVLIFVSFINKTFLSDPKNPFNKYVLENNGLSVSTLDKDPVKYRRIAMAKFELLEDYFGELNISDLVGYTQTYLQFNEEFSANNCKKEKKNEGIKNSKIYPFFDEAIRIDWNVWKGIIQQIDELTKTVKSMDSKKELTEYLKRAIFNEAMEIIMAKFSEFGLKLKAEVEEIAKKEDDLEEFLEVNLEAQLFELFFSFAARLEAIVHGKNIDGTIEKSQKNPRDKIRAFLAVPNCFNVPEWANKFSIFDNWMEIKVINSKSQIPAIGVEIFRKRDGNEEAKRISQENYKMLQRLNEQKFSIYESTKLLRHIYDRIEQKHSTTDEVKMPTIFKDLVSEIRYKWRKESNSDYRNYIDGCEFAKLFQNVSANFMNMKGIDVTLHMDKLDSKIQDYVKRDFEKHCEIIKRIDRTVEETKIALLNNVRYDLVINFKFNAWKDVRDRAEDLLGNLSTMEPTKEDTCIIENEITMTYYFTSKETNRERISKIEALKAKENDRFDLMGLFDKKMNSFYWAKTAFVSLMMISSITFEATCSGPVSDLFNSLIVGITSANEGEHSAASNSNQRPLELKLADAQMLQQWIGQIARKIVVEDGIFAGNYSRGPNININAVILTDGLPKERIKKIDKNILKELKEVQNLEQKGQFLKLLFSFGAMLSVEIGDQPQQNGTLRALLKAYECVGGKFAEEKDGIADFVIGAVIKSPIVQLKVDKLILERNNRRRIHELSLLNALNVEMTPKDVISFAAFIYNKFVSYPPINPFNKFILGWRELSLSTLDKDPVKYRRIAYQLLLHLKNWGPNELKEISLKKSDEDVIQLTQREKCFFGIFTRNLMQRMAKFELLEDYFGELNISRLIEYIQDYLAINEEYSANNCKKEKKNEGIENSKIYPFLDEAIRIDWNVWKGIIREIDELTKTVKSMDSKKEFTEYLEGAIFNEAMEIIMAKFSEFGLKLKAEVEEIRENSKDKIRAFLAVPNCFNVPEWANKFSIFDYWMEIKVINSKSQIPAIGVEIFKKIDENEEAKRISRGNYKTLKALNEQKFSFYESTKLLRHIYDHIEQKHSTTDELKMPTIFKDIVEEIQVKWRNERIDVTLHMDKLDSKIQDYVKRDFGKYCEIMERNGRKVEETKIALLNNVRYDLVINFKFNAWKDVRDRAEDLLGNLSSMEPAKEVNTLEEELEENKESAVEMWYSLGQMLEDVMKHYGQKMDKQKKDGERMKLLR
uniref:VWFA domain-containing protein n=1 Tax=Globodera rostochiensis TaxID=31243 RepID=A0A914ICS8_GLORO